MGGVFMQASVCGSVGVACSCIDFGMASNHFLLSFLLFSCFFISNCYILESSSSVPAYVFLNNNYKSIRSGFWGQAKQIAITSGHIAYFTSDEGQRSLKYVCANTSALCKFQTDVHSDGDTSIVSAWISIALPLVGMTGKLKLCSAPPHVFKKLPLVPPPEIDCQPWLSPEFPNQKEGYVIYPNSEVQDVCRLEVYTWFMTKSNYREMRSEDKTEVFVPLFDKTWELPLSAAFNTMLHSDVPSCWVKAPHPSADSDWLTLQHTEIIHQTYKFRYNITAEVGNSGEYAIKCSGMNWNEPRQKASKIETIKSLKITFVQGPKIVIPGGANSIAFPSYNVSGSFLLRIYSTSPINSLVFERNTMTKSTASDKQQFFAELQYSSSFDILNVYKVGIPWLTEELNGDYQVKVTNDDQESSATDLKIIKADAINVFVSPSHVSVGVGVSVSLECLAIGNLLKSVTWKRDFESVQNGKYAADIKEFENGKQHGVRLTLLKPRLQDSGHYTCTAANQFERREAIVELSVWLPGGPEIDPRYQPDETTTSYFAHIHGARVLNLTNEQILKEHTHIIGDRAKRPSVVGVIVGIVLSLAVVGGAIAVLAAYRCLWYKKLSQASAEREKTYRERVDSRENMKQGHTYADEELGLDQKLAQEDLERLFGDVNDDNVFESQGNGVAFDDDQEFIEDNRISNEDSAGDQGDDVNTPLLDKRSKKRGSKDKKSKREREEERAKRDKKRKKGDRKNEEGIRESKKTKKDKREMETSNKEQRETTERDDNSGLEIEDKKVELVRDRRRRDEEMTKGGKDTTAKGDKGTTAKGNKGTTAEGDKGTTTGGDKGTTTKKDKGTTAKGDKGTTAKGDKGTTAKGDKGTTAKGDKDTTAGGDKDTTAKGDKGTTAGGDKGATAKGTTAKGDKGTTAKGDKGTTAKGDMGTTAKGDKVTSAKGDKVTTAKGDMGTTAKGDKGTTAEGDKGTTDKGDKGTTAERDKGATTKGDNLDKGIKH